MTKSDYLSNSSKILLISSILLFVANALAFISSFNENFVFVAGKLSTISFYVVFILGFLAFNGEGIAFKHSKEIQKKKKTSMSAKQLKRTGTLFSVKDRKLWQLAEKSKE